uniref:Uncharacterized protein n=1 Tax=Rhizophora mucronata TaxID=61149 RepID=A0A2P2N223_RHIMU
MTRTQNPIPLLLIKTYINPPSRERQLCPCQ